MNTDFTINQGSLWLTTLWVLLSPGTIIHREEDEKECICIFLGTNEKNELIFFIQNDLEYITLHHDLCSYWIKSKLFTNVFEGDSNHKYTFVTKMTEDKGTPFTT